jgi:hypothetical protein
MPPESDSQRAPPPVMAPPPTPNDSNPPPPPASSLDFYELTFGSVCGICAGVFIKKGAKLVAFLLGGTFVLLQVMPISRPYALLPTSNPFVTSTSDPPLSFESTGLVPQAGSRIYFTERRTALDALPRSDPFGLGSSTFWLRISSHELVSQLGCSSVCGSVKLRVSVCTQHTSYLTSDKRSSK